MNNSAFLQPASGFFRDCLWWNFAAAIDMLRNAIAACPADLWNKNDQFYYISYHSVVFLDYYLTIPPVNFKPALSFTLIDPEKIPEGAIDDVLPDQLFSQEQMLEWLLLCRVKCESVINNLSDYSMQERWLDSSKSMDISLAGRDTLAFSVLQILFHNLRHVQHHTAQLNLLLRQQTGSAPFYISEAR